MVSIGKRLLASTADLASAVDAAASQGHGAGPYVPRTAPGQMLAAQGQVRELQAELEQLKAKLEAFDGSLPTSKLDPATIRQSDWANRHEASFRTQHFASLKRSIELAGGNTQPILVRRLGDGAFEIVFGHRRHRACSELGLPVMAVIWDSPMSELDLFLHMDRENRERADLSPWEQGVQYAKALEHKLFPSARRLAEALGQSHTWVNRALTVGQLPPAIVEAFSSPLDIQVRHAEAIQKALEADRKAVLRRAERVRQLPRKLSPSEVVVELTGQATKQGPRQDFKIDGKLVASVRMDPKGRAVVTLTPEMSTSSVLERLKAALGAGN